ncbi:MAG: M3 family metallopeptidase [Acidobacteria bacterium]|nr:M3 family metallopeptidase [Acidobacteriota bacterium]
MALCASLLMIPAMAKVPRPANPLLQEWSTPFQVPPFDRIKAEHFLPAFQEGFARQKAEVRAIARSKTAPTFQNTVEAFDDSGELLARVNGVFQNLVSAETSEALQAVNKEISPLLAAHADDLFLDPALFQRVKSVFEGRHRLSLDPEQKRLLERMHRRFIRGGAGLDGEKQARLRAINGELATLQGKFGDNLLAATGAFRLVVERSSDLAGLPEAQVHAAAEAAKGAGLDGKWVITLHAPSFLPFMENASNRDLRRQLLQAYTSRCDQGGPTDNKAVYARIVALRGEKARLLGYPTWAHFMLAENMALNPEGATGLLDQLWRPALEVARKDRADLQALLEKDFPGQRLEPWDWRYYETQVRKARYDVDEAAMRPYFALDQVRAGAFELARRLYGLGFRERKDLPVYHPEVRVFEVLEMNGKHLGVLYLDFFPRAGKQGGAWCNNFVDPWVKGGKDIRPVVTNVGNFSRPAGGLPALLSADEVNTLFHEFGHALHSLLSSVRYRGSGQVATDFVELPSQVMEHWAFEPEMLKRYARHHRTGEVIPQGLVEKLRRAERFGQGFATVEYLAACYLDLDWHTRGGAEADVTTFEKAAMARIGMLPEILPRYRTPYFHHSAAEYCAQYYSYIWSAVLDADAFQAFKEKGDLFHPATAAAFRALLAKAGSEDPAVLYRSFRGRDPRVEPLLEKRGLK